MKLFPDKYGDFTALDDLASILRLDPTVIGIFQGKSEGKGAHVTVASPEYSRAFKFIKQDDGSFILQVIQVEEEGMLH